jgi:putative membrane protein
VLLADPLPAVCWALPVRARAALGRLLRRRAAPRRAWRALTRLPIAWALWAITLGLWHVPAAYDATLAHGWVHDAAHVTLAASAVVFWWPVIGPAPRSATAPPVARVVYLVLAAFASGALGVLLAASSVPLYAYPAPPGGVTALEDQAWGGVVMWAVGGAVDMAAVLAVVARVVGSARGRALS